MQIVGVFTCHSIFRRAQLGQTNHSRMRGPDLDRTLKSLAALPDLLSRPPTLVHDALPLWQLPQSPPPPSPPRQVCKVKSLYPKRRHIVGGVDIKVTYGVRSFRCVTFYAASHNLCHSTAEFFLISFLSPQCSSFIDLSLLVCRVQTCNFSERRSQEKERVSVSGLL